MVSLYVKRRDFYIYYVHPESKLSVCWGGPYLSRAYLISYRSYLRDEIYHDVRCHDGVAATFFAMVPSIPDNALDGVQWRPMSYADVSE